ncbi:hypothetical protein BH23ACT12_BH23ACT12_10180 [soil metagenome]
MGDRPLRVDQPYVRKRLGEVAQQCAVGALLAPQDSTSETGPPRLRQPPGSETHTGTVNSLLGAWLYLAVHFHFAVEALHNAHQNVE